jgi:putative redox protein
MGFNTINSIYTGGMGFQTLIRGHEVNIDLDKDHGGNNKGTSPKILMLVSLAGCTGLDVVAILKKMKVQFSDLTINIHAHLTDTDPRIYDDVDINYAIRVAQKDQPKVERAVTLSQEKYCGVSEMFRAFSRLTHRIEFLS